MFRIALLIALLCMQPMMLRAQIVTGTVLEDSARTPITGAIIEIIGIDRAKDGRAVSDSGGSFVIRPRRSGSFVVHVYHPSYVSRDSMALQIRPGQIVQLEVRMGRRAIPVEPLVVRTLQGGRLAGFLERARQGGPGIFLTRDRLVERKGGRYTTDLLRGLPGVQVLALAPPGGSDLAPAPPPGTSNETRPRTQIIAMSDGATYCEPAVFVDGMRVKQYADSGVDELLRPDMIEGVEVYARSAGAPAEFLTSNQCGVIVFWTRATADASGKLTWKRVRLAGLFVLVMTGLVTALDD